MITKLDGHLLLAPDAADELSDLLELLAEVLRYGGDDLRDDIAERFHGGMHAALVETLDTHIRQLRIPLRAGTTERTPR